MRKIVTFLAALLVLAVSGCAPQVDTAFSGLPSANPQQAPSATDRLVVLVGWDGADWRVVSEMVAAGELPEIARLSPSRLETVEVTHTKPSWATQLSGLGSDVHGTFSNFAYRAVPASLTVFEQLRARSIKAAWVGGKCEGQRAGNMCVGRFADGTDSPFLNVPASVDFLVTDSSLSLQQLTAACLDAVRMIGRGFAFCHYPEPDTTGHAEGGGSAAYRDALRAVDAELGVLLAGLPLDAAVLITSDHGFELPADQQTDPPDVPRYFPFGFSHVNAPDGIMASNRQLSADRAIGRDIARTVYALLCETPPAALKAGKELVACE